MAERGYLDGSRMATVFNMLRPRDLIWPYIVNNYMLGKKPFPFDLLFWNQDSTRMPAANHNFYLREFYHENKLASGQMTIGGVQARPQEGQAADLRAGARARTTSRRPSRCSSARRLFGGPVEYVLAGSGHIAGVVNPPPADKKPKYQYWTNDKTRRRWRTWIEGAKETSGLLVAALDRVARQAVRRHGAGPHAGRDARRHRGRARQLRQDQELKSATVAMCAYLRAMRRWPAGDGAEAVYLQVLDLGDLDHLRLIAAEVMPQLS